MTEALSGVEPMNPLCEDEAECERRVLVLKAHGGVISEKKSHRGQGV